LIWFLFVFIRVYSWPKYLRFLNRRIIRGLVCMERARAIPLGLMLVLLAAGVAVAQTQTSRVSPIREAQSQVQQPRVAPVLPVNQGNAPLMPVVQNPGAQSPVVQSTASQPAQPVVLPPSQMPPSPPRITYVGGKLTVVANNSILDDVLTGVGKAIGANIQGGGSQGVERVFGQFGPASPSQVLDILLIGSRYDFVLVGSTESADSVREIILSPSSAEAAQSAQLVPASSSVQAQTTDRADSFAFANQQQTEPQSPEEQQGFRPNRRGPGARAIMRPQTLAPNTSPAPQQTDVPLRP
jgi:hypothetical protein